MFTARAVLNGNGPWHYRASKYHHLEVGELLWSFSSHTSSFGAQPKRQQKKRESWCCWIGVLCIFVFLLWLIQNQMYVNDNSNPPKNRKYSKCSPHLLTWVRHCCAFSLWIRLRLTAAWRVESFHWSSLSSYRCLVFINIITSLPWTLLYNSTHPTQI